MAVSLLQSECCSGIPYLALLDHVVIEGRVGSVESQIQSQPRKVIY